MIDKPSFVQAFVHFDFCIQLFSLMRYTKRKSLRDLNITISIKIEKKIKLEELLKIIDMFKINSCKIDKTLV